MAEVRNVTVDELNVRIFDSRQSMGEAAAKLAAEWIRQVAAEKEEVKEEEKPVDRADKLRMIENLLRRN